MTNLEAIRSLSNAICNTFFPDTATIEIVMLNEGVIGEAETQPKDPIILKCAINLVRGYIEGSSSQNGVSTSVRSQEAINASIKHYCSMYGVDATEYGIEDLTLMNISDMW